MLICSGFSFLTNQQNYWFLSIINFKFVAFSLLIYAYNFVFSILKISLFDLYSSSLLFKISISLDKDEAFYFSALFFSIMKSCLWVIIKYDNLSFNFLNQLVDIMVFIYKHWMLTIIMIRNAFISQSYTCTNSIRTIDFK